MYMYAPQPTIHHFIIMISSRTRRLGGWAFETVFLTDTRIPQNLPLGKYVGTVAYGTVFVDMYFIYSNCNLSVSWYCPLCTCTCPKNKSHAINDDVRHVGGQGENTCNGMKVVR